MKGNQSWDSTGSRKAAGGFVAVHPQPFLGVPEYLSLCSPSAENLHRGAVKRWLLAQCT